MARTKTTPATPAEAPAIRPEKEAAIIAVQDAAMTGAEQEELMDLGRRLGQMEAASFFGNISDGILISAYENVKKSKAWKRLSGKDGKSFPNLDAFCQERLGYSERRLRQVLTNRDTLGTEAYEQAERLGLRQVDYDTIKALPAPDQELVRRAVEEAQSRADVLDLMQELAVRTAQERKGLTKQIDSAKKDSTALEKRLEVVTKQKDDAEARAARIAVTPPDEALAELHEEAAVILAEAQGIVRGKLRNAMVALQNHDEDNGAFMAGLVAQVQADLQTLRDEFNLPDAVGDGTPAWQAWNAQQDASARPQ